MRWAAVTAAVAALSLCGALPVGSAPVSALSEAPFTIGFPARGAFLSGPAQVTLTGTLVPEVARLEVNGKPATIAGAAWSLGATLAFGVNTFALRAFDQSGQEIAHTSWSVLYSPTYLPADTVVRDAVGTRFDVASIAQLVPPAVDALTASGLLQTALTSGPVRLPGHLQIFTVAFDTPRVTATPQLGGFQLQADLPRFSLEARFAAGALRVSASDAHLDATLLLAVAAGRFEASMPVRPEVTLMGLTGGPRGLIERALQSALQAALPGAVEQELNQAGARRAFSLGGIPATIESQPDSLAIDPGGVTTLSNANISPVGTPLHPDVPGSISRTGSAATPPAFTGSHDVSLTLREDLLNRALLSAWQGGLWNVTVDQAFLAQQGINLPFPLDSSLLLPFFPALQSLLPPGQPVPLSFQLEPILPPVVTLTGAPNLLTASYGELHVTIQLDLAQGAQPLLTLDLHAELPVSPTISNGLLRLTLDPPLQAQADVLENPLALPAADVDRFLQSGLPLTVALAGSTIPPIPLPPLPPGFQPTNADVFQDGAGGDFLTVAGDL
jgi:hypothetical protein